tara:strand:+ start:324 stop:998 length:675 start_codon:yes stop_codon:yes gene_type:complete
MVKTKDPVNQELIEKEKELGLDKFGLMTSNVWQQDPKRLIFTLARYKFVSKMLDGKKYVAEIGCGDGFGSRIVRQTVKNLHITDYDPYFIERFKEISSDKWPITSQVHNILDEPLERKFNSIYSLDVFEHIEKKQEKLFIRNILESIYDDGVVILGTPSIESQKYASSGSKLGHVNCKSGKELKKLVENYFHNVFLFSMNDEVVHTGFEKMAHYLFVVCTGRRH